MNFRKSIYLLASVLIAGLTACSVDELDVTVDQEIPQLPQLSADVVGIFAVGEIGGDVGVGVGSGSVDDNSALCASFDHHYV